MTKTIEATFDGAVLHPEEPLEIPPNTRVRLTIETEAQRGEPASFLRTAQELHLSGPSDWSRDLREYLYGANAPSDR
jgi:predicted DNA-binding antitoxin AbrB/MazE fold protein